MDASQMMIHFGQKPLGNEFYCQLKENHVPEQYAQYLMEIKTQKPQDFYIILKAFKTGGRLKPLEQLLIHNNSYFKPEEAYEKIEVKKNVEVYNDEYYKMIIENPYFENCNLIEEKKVADILTQGFIPQQDNFIWALVVEKSQLLKKEVNFLAQNQFKEQLQINVYGQDISDQKKEFISGWTEQDINKRISALLNVEPGDIIGLINPEKSLDRQAYATLAVKCNQIFFIKSGIDLDQFLDKQILNKPMNQLQQEKRKIFVQKYLKTRKAIWSEKNIVDLIQILTKACYYDEVDKFCNIFNNINMVLSNLSNQTKQEINKSLFLCNMKRGLHQEALSYYQKAQNEGLIMDQYKEEIIQILFNFRKFDEVQKEWQTLDNRQQNKLKHIIAQTNLILDFKNEGKNFDKINYYGPIEIRKATIQLGRDDRVQDIGRGIFLTKKVNKRQLLWAERDLTYKPNQRNNVKTMFETLKDMLSNNLLRARLRHLYQDGMTNFTFPEVSLYSNDNYDLQKQGCVPQITDEDLWNIVNSSSHTIYPKLYQSEQTKEEEGLWPIFSFVNHSISNRNIEVIVQQGFLFVFSTMSLPENTQIFYNYVLNIDNEDVIKSVKSKYGLQEL